VSIDKTSFLAINETTFEIKKNVELGARYSAVQGASF